MSLLDYANLFNATGLALILAISWLVLARYPSVMFREWTRAYGALFAGVTLDLVADMAHLGRPLLCVRILAAVTAAWYFWRTACVVRGRRLPSGRWYGAAAAGFLLLAGVQLSQHTPIFWVILAPILVLSTSELALGGALLRAPAAAPQQDARWLGAPIALLGLWIFTYPFFDGTALFWVGYWVSGVLNLFIGMGMVVHLLDESAQALRQKNAKLEQLDQMRARFLGTVSHELRTPLASVQGYLELLEDEVSGPLNAAQHQFVQQMGGAAGQLRGLIDALLDSAQLDAGALAVAVEPIDLGDATARAIAALRPLLDSKGLALACEFAEPLPAALADPQRVTQVLNNLLSNAIKFTPAGGQIGLTLERQAAFLVTRVSDTGIGIPEEKCEEVFLPFVQADGSLTRHFGGTGLGLSITKQLIEAMGGRITLESSVGKGTIVTFTLPIAPAAVARR